MKQVILPDGEAVSIPNAVDCTWFEHEKTGYLDPRILAPYAKQPRLYMDPAKLKELEASVKHQGVRESIVITPSCKAPWAVFHPGDEKLPFLIVSGHRRHEVSMSSSITAVPVKIRVYADEAAFNKDADTLNDHRQDLSEIEIGWQYRRKIEAGEKVTHLVKNTGHAYQWIMGRIHLTYLCPTIQELISPELKPRERMAIGFASALGSLKITEGFDVKQKLTELGVKVMPDSNMSGDELRFFLQQSYLRYCRARAWKGTISEKFVRTGQKPEVTKYSSGYNAKIPTVPATKPHSFRMQVVEWVRYLNEIGFLDMKRADIAKHLSHAVAQDLEAMAGRIEMVAATLRQVAGEKPRYSEEALAGNKRPEQKVLED